MKPILFSVDLGQEDGYTDVVIIFKNWEQYYEYEKDNFKGLISFRNYIQSKSGYTITDQFCPLEEISYQDINDLPVIDLSEESGPCTR